MPSKICMKEISKQLANFIVEKIIEKKGESVLSIYIGDKENAVTDYFIICTVGSNTQAYAITNFIIEKVKEEFSENPYSKEGVENGFWILLDYIRVVVHIFQPQYRDFYRIEELWGDGKIQKFPKTF